MNFQGFWVMTAKIIDKDKFVLKKYLGTTPFRNYTFVFKEKIIGDLPFIEKGSKDVFDAGVNGGGFSLILRLVKRSKVFYFKPTYGSMKKIGPWQERKDSRHYPKGFFSLAMARKEFNKLKEQWDNFCAESAAVGEWTIERYIDEKYEDDRKIHKIKNGGIKPLEDLKVLKNIKSDIRPWINNKIKDANEEWIQEFIDYWETPRENPTNRVLNKKSKDTQRKAYSVVNSMFNICTKAKYITHNPLDGFAYLFKDDEAEERDINTYDIDPDIALKFIFEDAPGNLAGKVILATMVLAGVRNSEAYRNFRQNFQIDKKNLHIPAIISRKTKKKRDIPIESEYYWAQIRIYLSTSAYFENDQGYMFPSHKMSATGHVTHGVTRDPWNALKLKFGFSKSDRAYDFRHTFASKVTEKVGVETAAKIIGDKPETLMKYYLKHEIDDTRPMLAEIQKGSASKLEKEIESSTVYEASEVVKATDFGMPDAVKHIFETYRNGKVLPGENLMYKKQWNSFVSVVRKMSENGIIKDADTWLMIQSYN
ncbi:MAG: integrase [Oleiphilaceae bacterium]|jgi:integrase